ncbi:hypothetical protein D3C85_916760 [compost metagenome]
MTLKTDIAAGLALLPAKMDSLDASVLLYATNRQENPQRLQQQVGGPAVGDYQFELGGGVKGVMSHHSVAYLTRAVCDARGIEFKAGPIYQALKTDDILAAALARLLYYTDPKALPKAGDEAEAWALYLRTWRPGAYARQPEELRAKWKKNYADAMEAYGL